MEKKTGMKEDKKKLYCCSSYYQVFIALIKALAQGKVIDLVLEEHGIETARQLGEKLETQMKSCVDRVFVCPDNEKINPYRQRCASFLPWQRRQILRHMEGVFAGIKNPLGQAALSGEIAAGLQEYREVAAGQQSYREVAAGLQRYQEIHVFWDLGYAGTYLNIRHIPYILQEDSLNSYRHIRANRPNYAYIFRKNGWKFKLKQRFHLGVIPFGYSDNCIAVEVNEKAGIEIPLDKVREVSREELINQLTREQKKELFALFVPGEDGKTGSIWGEKDRVKEERRLTLLLTEPFAVTGRLPDEKAQVSLYRDVLAGYAKNSQVLIKPHPRDDMDYRKYFPDVQVMEKNIPMEVLNFDENFRVFRAVTVSSSAIEGLTCAQEKIYLGQDVLCPYKTDVPGRGVL